MSFSPSISFIVEFNIIFGKVNTITKIRKFKENKKEKMDSEIINQYMFKINEAKLI